MRSRPGTKKGTRGKAECLFVRKKNKGTIRTYRGPTNRGGIKSSGSPCIILWIKGVRGEGER